MMQEEPKDRPGQKSGGGEEDLYDTDASEPEVPKGDAVEKEPDEKPSQAEGEEEDVDQ
jgi:hypothetical protein